MREILRRPVDLGPGEDADFARLHGDGASNKMLRSHNESYTLCATVLPQGPHAASACIAHLSVWTSECLARTFECRDVGLDLKSSVHPEPRKTLNRLRTDRPKLEGVRGIPISDLWHIQRFSS